MASLIPETALAESFPGEADHFGIPLDGFLPSVADPDVMTRLGGWEKEKNVKNMNKH